MIIRTNNQRIIDLKKKLSIANSKLEIEQEEHKVCIDRAANLRMELTIRDAMIKKLRDENAFLQKALLRAIENQDATVEELREQLDETESKLDDVQAENEGLQAELDECTLPTEYQRTGMSRSDFEGGSVYG